MKTCLVYGVIAAVMSVSAASTANAQSTNYTYKRVLDTTGEFAGFSGININNNGDLSLTAFVDGDANDTAVLKYNGTSFSTIVDSRTSDLDFVFSSAINDRGNVAYIGASETTGASILAISNGTDANTVISLAADSGLGFGGVSLNNDGSTVYSLGDFFEAGSNSVNVDGTTILENLDNVSGVDINDNGTIAASVSRGSFDDQAIIVEGPTNTFTLEAGSNELFDNFNSSNIDINNTGQVVFFGQVNSDVAGEFLGNAIAVADGESVSFIASTADREFSFFQSVDINNAGSVAFSSTVGFADAAITVATNGILESVLSTETQDVLDGDIVRGIRFGGLNDRGDIAFSAVFQDGTEAIYIASLNRIGAVPEPATWLMMILGFAIVTLRLQKRRKCLVNTLAG